MAKVVLIASIAMFAFGVLLIPLIITRLPPDYFLHAPEDGRTTWGPPAHKHTLGFWAANVGGALLVVLGILMLVLPGQGVLTILLGLSLLSFPGKRRVQLRLLRMPPVHHAIDALRKRAGKPPLRLDGQGSETASAH